MEKLRIGQPGDKYEQEADWVADAVMRMPDPEEEEMLQSKPLANQITPLVQRQVEPEEEEEELQIKTTSGGISKINSNLISYPLKAAASRCLNPSVPIFSRGLELILARCGCIVMRRRLNLHGH